METRKIVKSFLEIEIGFGANDDDAHRATVQYLIHAIRAGDGSSSCRSPCQTKRKASGQIDRHMKLKKEKRSAGRRETTFRARTSKWKIFERKSRLRRCIALLQCNGRLENSILCHCWEEGNRIRRQLFFD